MKLKDVKVGGLYLTKVGDELVRVRVREMYTSRITGRTAFYVERVDNGRPLQKPRAPAALRPL